MTDDQFVCHARRLARKQVPLRPYQDDEVLSYGITIHQKVSDDLDAQVRYSVMRLQGQSHNVAEMLATRSFPGLKTDSIFNENRTNGNQFANCPARGDWLKAEAEKAGVSVTGKTYMPGLAEFPGDPMAWVSDRSDVLRVAREKNLNVQGYVTHAAIEGDPEPDIVIASDLVQAEVDDIMGSIPGVRREDVEERVREVRSGLVDPNPLRVTDHDFHDI